MLKMEMHFLETVNTLARLQSGRNLQTPCLCWNKSSLNEPEGGGCLIQGRDWIVPIGVVWKPPGLCSSPFS